MDKLDELVLIKQVFCPWVVLKSKLLDDGSIQFRLRCKQNNIYIQNKTTGYSWNVKRKQLVLPSQIYDDIDHGYCCDLTKFEKRIQWLPGADFEIISQGFLRLVHDLSEDEKSSSRQKAQHYNTIINAFIHKNPKFGLPFINCTVDDWNKIEKKLKSQASKWNEQPPPNFITATEPSQQDPDNTIVVPMELPDDGNTKDREKNTPGKAINIHVFCFVLFCFVLDDVSLNFDLT